LEETSTTDYKIEGSNLAVAQLRLSIAAIKGAKNWNDKNKYFGGLIN